MSTGIPPVFPLIRHLSIRVTPALAATPMSANQITAASLLAGLGCTWAMMQGGWMVAVVGAVLLVVAYVLDNCDGEIARLKNQCSEFGMRFDSFVDWIVNAAFFAGLGIGVHRATGDAWWEWMGWIAFAGSTINYAIGWLVELRARRRKGQAYDTTGREAAEQARRPETWYEWMVFAFRELSRADFCFIVLLLAVLDVHWLLLPAGAIGSQVYWATQFVKGANEYHV